MLHTLVVRMQLAGANCTVGAPVRMALAEELTRQNGAPEQRLGDRQMGATDGGTFADGDGQRAGAGQR